MRFLRILLTITLSLILTITFFRTGEGALLAVDVQEQEEAGDPHRTEAQDVSKGTAAEKTAAEEKSSEGSSSEEEESEAFSERMMETEEMIAEEKKTVDGSLSASEREPETSAQPTSKAPGNSGRKEQETLAAAGSETAPASPTEETGTAPETTAPETTTPGTMTPGTMVPETTAPAASSTESASEFCGLLPGVRETDSDFYFRLANQAVSDMLNHFWDHTNNHMIPTWDGLPVTAAVDQRGSFWETAQCLYALYDLWYMTRDVKYERMLQGQAKFIKENFTAAELTEAGGNENWAVDDCAWNCMLYLILYRMTGDTWFIEVTDGLLNSVTARWGDDVTGGGLWYNDTKTIKSVYELGCVISWLRLWEITGEKRYYDQAFAQYQWMLNMLSRGDGLYWCDYSANGPRGSLQDIHEAGSSSFLTGNMGMAALSVMFYRITGNEAYRTQALKTCEGLLRYYNDGGVLLDDRDGWTNGAFASFFASYVLTLDGTEEIRELCRATAKSIILNARTSDGYYGATWKGPAEGSGSIWYRKGTVPRQSATTGSAISMVTSMAILEAGISDYRR